ncbi:MAG TPA: winged helix-turn-helix domain-containing protein [Vicinamibacterales bacterium]|nr:winged helix-turn-helix domain-containing protein [Vicinamibacterales bacterium]
MAAHVRRQIRFGPYEVDVSAGEIRKHGRRVRLQEKPFRILEALLEYPGEVVGRDELRARLWPADTFVDFDTGLNSAVNKVRRALGDSAAHPVYVETLGRRGYRFRAPVEAPEAPPPAGGPVPSPPAITSLAVLPLANLSGDERETYFCDGMTEALIAQIAGIRALRVISRQSIVRYKDSRMPLPAIARELRVDGLIGGSVLRDGGRVRIGVQLVEGATDRHVWNGRWERELQDVLVIQSEIATAVARAVAAAITDDEQSRLARARDIDPTAYDLYLKGRYFWRSRTREGLLRSVEYYRKALALDPQFALAHAAEAESLGPLGYLAFVPPGESSPAMRAAATRALAIDPSLVEGLTALGACEAFHEWRWRDSEEHFKRAIAVNPNYSTAFLWYGKALEIEGRFDESLAATRRGVALDPLSLRARAALAWALCMNGDADEGLHEFDSVLELDPHNFFGLRDRAVVHASSGRPGEAAAAFVSTNELGSLVHALAVDGRRAGACDVLARLEAASRDVYISPLQFAVAYLGLEQTERVWATLERGVDTRAVDLAGVRVDPRFASLRGDARFDAVLARMGLPPSR